MLTIKRLGLDDAKALIAGAKAKAEEIVFPCASPLPTSRVN